MANCKKAYDSKRFVVMYRGQGSFINNITPILTYQDPLFIVINMVPTYALLPQNQWVLKCVTSFMEDPLNFSLTVSKRVTSLSPPVAATILPFPENLTDMTDWFWHSKILTGSIRHDPLRSEIRSRQSRILPSLPDETRLYRLLINRKSKIMF